MKRAAVSRGFSGLRPVAAPRRAAGLLMLLAVSRPHVRGMKGNIQPINRKYFESNENTSENGANIMAKTRGACVLTWLSGCGTMRGAGSIRILLLDVDDRGDDVKPFRSVSCRRMSCGACYAAAAATASTAGSPSKKRAIAICTFHSQRRRRGIAADGSWSVTAVNCCSESCWSEVKAAVSTIGSAILKLRSQRWRCSFVRVFRV
jgi:hypothetical protein